MLHILFTVFKIIGIVILVLVSLAILILLMILFLPVKYKIQGSYDKEFEVTAKVTWLFPFLYLKAFYHTDNNVILRILGIKVYDKKKPKKVKKRHASKSKKTHPIKEKSSSNELKTGKNQKEKLATKTSENENTEKKPYPKDEKETIINKSEIVKQNKLSQTDDTRENKDTTTSSEKEKKQLSIWNRFIEKLKRLLEKAKQILRTIKYTIMKIYDTILHGYENIHYYNELFHDERTLQAYRLCKKQLYSMWRNIKPRKLNVYLHVGNENPEATGEMMAFYGLVYPFIYQNVQIVPEFQQTIFEAKFDIKGRITVFIIIKVLLCVYFNKDVKYFLRMLKKEDSNVR